MVRETRRGSCALAAALAVLVLGGGSAHAAPTYTVHACERGDTQPAGWSGWSASIAGAEGSDVDRCSTGGSRTLTLRGNRSMAVGAHAELSFAAPADTSIFAYTIWRSVQLAGAARQAFGYTHAQGSRSSAIDTCHVLVDGCTRRGDMGQRKVQANAAWQYGLRGVRNLWLGVGCVGPSSCGAVAGDAGKLAVHAADIHLEDPYPPEFVGAPQGALVSGGAVSGIQTVSLVGHDRGGGVREAIAEIDGREVARGVLDDNGGACRPPYTQVVPCKLDARGALAIDTTRVPDGRHELRLRLTDATGANVGALGPLPIETRNGCERAPRSSAYRVSAGVATSSRGRTRTSRTLSYGRSSRLRGQLRRANGSPVAGATLCVISRPRMSRAQTDFEGRVRTDSRGRYSMRLKAGPSRDVYVVHRADEASSVDRVRVNVRAAVTLKPERRWLRNGQLLALEGRVRGRPIPERGALLELQARRPTGWQTFRVTRTRSNGRFRARYRFSRTTGVQRYRLRARVSDQASYPYEVGSSRLVTVYVRSG